MEYVITRDLQQSLASAVQCLCASDEAGFEQSLVDGGLYSAAGEPTGLVDGAAGWVLGHALSLPSMPSFDQLLQLTNNTFLYLDMPTTEAVLQMAESGQMMDLDTTSEELLLCGLAVLAINYLKTGSFVGLVQTTDIRILVDADS